MRRGEHAPQAFQAPVDVHASADGQVYMFKRRPNENAVSSDEEEVSVVEMRQMKRDRQNNVQLLEREVLDGDNLNKIALQYGCKVADIKRINNLMHDQDLFALKSIKIPVQRHSVLTETLSDSTDLQEGMPHSAPAPVRSHDRARAQSHLQEVTDFLMEVDSDIDKLIQTTTDHDEDFLDNSEKPQRFSFRRPRLSSHGADWGIQWWNAVIAMLLIGIVLPLFYVIYFKTRDNGASPTDAALQLSTSSNTSGTGLGTRAPEQFQEPG
ncbi:lysM and putative peptidoglycan-binding domain-containing protein 4 [Melanotaenia boesemani]|uniref:lysM and putative peptidoglycan-binding domain-containing protein 4 n=1 Tax=Melanotaenia boesemani TaxID=1250792 RepID=UPI001C0541F6|nr:lysM and putative peptidoglycan-binding domain-containing protein 4 [Melanotaenia boesemani]